MFDISMLANAAQGMSASLQLLQAVAGAKIDSEAQKRVAAAIQSTIEAQTLALSAYQQAANLLKSHDALETEVRALRNWDSEKQRYHLADAGNGVLAFQLKPEFEATEPKHWLCPTCYARGEKSILQPETIFPGRGKALVCNACGADLIIGGHRDMMVRPRPVSRRR